MMSNPEQINFDNNDLNKIKNLSRKDKILFFLKKKGSEMSREDLSEKTNIDFTNLSKILGALEKEGKIMRRYEQIGRSKYCYVSLLTNSLSIETNSQSQPPINNSTNSLLKKTNSQIETINSKNKTTPDQEGHSESRIVLPEETNSLSKTNSQSGSSTNSPTSSQLSKTNSQIEVPRDPRLLLTEENLINFVKAQERTKVYEMKIRFLDNSALEIKKLVDSLKKRAILAQGKNGWIFLKSKEGGNE